MPISSGALGNPNSYFNKPENMRATMKRPTADETKKNKDHKATKWNSNFKGKGNGKIKRKKKKTKKGKRKKFAEDDENYNGGLRGMFTRMFTRVNETKVQDISGKKMGKNNRNGKNDAFANGGAGAGLAFAGSSFTSEDHSSISVMSDHIDGESMSVNDGKYRKKPMKCCCCICRCYLCCCCCRGLWCWLLLLLLLLLLAGLIAGIVLAAMAIADAAGDDNGEASTAPTVPSSCAGNWGEAFFGYRKNESADVNSTDYSTYLCCYNYTVKAANKTFYPGSYAVINKSDCLDTGASCEDVWGSRDPARCFACALVPVTLYAWCVVFVCYLYFT